MAGVAIAAALLLASRPAAGGETVGAEVNFYAAPSGEIAVSPAGPKPFLTERALRPGEAAGGAVELANQTGQRLSLRPRALPSSDALDELLDVQLLAGDRVLASGPLGSLREAGGRALLLDPGERATLWVSASLDEGASDAAAAFVDVAIHLELKDAAP